MYRWKLEQADMKHITDHVHGPEKPTQPTNFCEDYILYLWALRMTQTHIRAKQMLFNGKNNCNDVICCLYGQSGPGCIIEQFLPIWPPAQFPPSSTLIFEPISVFLPSTDTSECLLLNKGNFVVLCGRVVSITEKLYFGVSFDGGYLYLE